MVVMIILVLLFASVTTSNANYYHILSSANDSDSCPQDCLTLSQFTGNSSLYNGYNKNITLLFHPGNHSLAVELSIAAARNISMIAANVHGADTAFISCFNQSGRFHIRNSTFVWIKDLYFVGCGGNEIFQAEYFILENATFHGVSFERWSSSLVLHRVANGIIVESSFLLNSNYGHGGAMYISDSSFSIDNSHFTGNGASFEGGVVYSFNSLFNISTSHFADNVALKGGVIYSSASVFHITDSTFVNNSASKGGGVLRTENSSFAISTSKFANNGASIHGGVIAVLDSVVFISSSNFTNNKASSGGVIHAYASFFNICRNNFINNTALVSGVSQSSFDLGEGTGGVMYTSHSSFSFINNTVKLSSVYQTGGVMYILQSSFICNIIASNFIKNDAWYSGGVIFTRDSRIGIVSSIFVENGIEWDGGVLYTHNSSLSISTSRFTHNRAGNQGGVILIRQSSLSIINSNFMENNASHSGGAIRVNEKSLFSIAASNFTNNRASYGGAILFIEASTFNITDTTFTENRATYSGGALYVQWWSSGAITSSKFIKNYAAYGAVLFVNIRSSIHILTSTFDSNKDSSSKDNFEFESRPNKTITCTGKSIAKIMGDIIKCSIHRGVIVLTESWFNVTSCNFTNNYATLGVITAFKSNFIISNSIYANNEAKIGGVMSTFNASFSVSDSSFSKNLARLGGVACTFESSFSIFHSNFTDNEASFDGGVMYTVSTLQDFHVTISDSTFSDNKANNSGIMYITGTEVDMNNDRFYQNSGSFYAFSSNITFRGTTRFENCTEPSQKHNSELSRKEGGAITSYHSTVTFTGEAILLNNQARDGGAIVAIDSDIIRPQQFNILFLIQCNIKNQCGRAALFTNTAGKTQHVIHRDTELTLFHSAL